MYQLLNLPLISFTLMVVTTLSLFNRRMKSENTVAFF